MSAETDARIDPRDALVVGGGIAGIEALMALADLGDNRLRVRVVAESTSFVLPREALGVPWGRPSLHIDLEQLCRAFGARFVLGTVTGVDADARCVYTSGGHQLDYERLLLAPGARFALPYGATRTIGFGVLPEALARDMAGSAAIVVPAAASWTMPAYQLALSAAGAGRDVRVLTAEDAPLQAFGPATHAATSALLDRHEVVVETGHAPAPGTPISGLADTVIALPLLGGPAIEGLPLDAQGFVRVDDHMAVDGLADVHAAGDATRHAIKQGGLAAQQADTAAAEIVRSCGGATPRIAYDPVLRGKLTTPDGEELYLQRVLDGRDPGRAAAGPLWHPPGALCARRLAGWLEFHHADLDHHAVGTPS